MLNEKQHKAYKDFASTMSGDAALDEKTAYLVRLAAAIAMSCQP